MTERADEAVSSRPAATLEVIAGLALSALGASPLAGITGPLADYAYPIVWWGMLLLLRCLQRESLRPVDVARKPTPGF